MDVESLYIAYKVSRKHNRRSEDMVFFEVDLYANLHKLCRQINARKYTPLHNYSFMHRRGANPREVFAAEPPLKVMMAYALTCLTVPVESHLSNRTFNNRIGMGAYLAVNTVANDIYEVSRGYTRPCWILKIDYKGYFPNMNRDVAWNTMSSLVNKEYHRPNKPDVLYCLYVACYCDPCRSKRKSPLWEWNDYPEYKSVYRRPNGIGGFIGYTFWQCMASLYPTEIDKFIEENISKYYARYVDDTVIVTDNKDVALTMIPRLRDKLSSIGLSLHPKKFYCQYFVHGVEFLGYRILPGRIHMKRRTVNKALAVAADTKRGKRNYMDSINSYLGMIKGTSDTRLAKKILDSVRRKGFKKDYKDYKLNII